MTGCSGGESGKIMHYIADYFTFPHNRTFDGTLRQHNSYEKNLKNELKAFVKSGKADVYAEKKLKFENLGELDDFIKDHHREYLGRKRNIDEDIHYISQCMLPGISGAGSVVPGRNVYRNSVVKLLKQKI